MKKIIALLLLTTFAVLPGCAREYEAKQKADSQIAFVKESNRRRAVTEIMKVITTAFEDAAIAEKKEAAAGGTPILPETSKVPAATTDIQYAMLTIGKMSDNMTAMFQSVVDANTRVQLAQAKVSAIQYMQPIIEAMYPKDDGRRDPMSTNEVLSKLVGNIPFMTTVAGMYGLGVAGLDAAGDTITAAISGNNSADLNIKSTVAHNGAAVINGGENTVSQQRDNIEHAPAEEEEEVIEEAVEAVEAEEQIEE